MSADKTHDTVIVRPDELDEARESLMRLANMHGVDLSVPANAAFFDQMVKNRATSHAWMNFFANAMGADSFDGAVAAAKRRIGITD